MHNVCHRFESVESIRSALYHEFENEITDEGDYNLGYFEGKQQKKKWLVSQSDLQTMYELYHGKAQICLWCDGKDPMDDEDQPNPAKKRKKKVTADNSINEKEDEVESIFQKLVAKHGTVKYAGAQLRLGSNETHDDLDHPPNVPMITGVKHSKQKESLTDALTSAAVAVAKVFSPSSENSKPLPLSQFSPSKKIDLRMKNLEQLRQLQQLKEDGIISPDEFHSQKKIVLTSLSNLV